MSAALANRVRAALASGLLRTIAVVVLMTAAGPAMSDGPGWTSNSTVVRLVVTFDGGINVRLSPELGGCVSNSGYGPAFASVYPNHPGINRINATLLAAKLSATPVAIYLADNTCRIGEVLLGGW